MANIEPFIILIIIGIVLYKIFSGNSSKSKKIDRTERRNIQSRSQTNQIETSGNQSLIKNAQRQVSRGNFDEASKLYLRAGQVFTAAKINMFKGKDAANETIELIRVNASHRFDVILDNLVNEFYFRLNKPDVAATLLRSAGYHERAEAIEVAAGIAPSERQVVSQMQTSSQTQVVQPKAEEKVQETPAKMDLESVQPVMGAELDDFLDSRMIEETEEETTQKTTAKSNIPNTLMMASGDLTEKCLVCRKSIQAGDAFIYCTHCGKPGHYRDFGEMMKVTGKCPSCKQRLVRSMYNLD